MWSGMTACGNSTRPGKGNTGTGCFGWIITSGHRVEFSAELPAGAAVGAADPRRLLLILAHELQQVVDVVLDLHLGVDLRHPSGLVDHERGALDAHVLLAVEVLLLVHAEH